MACFDVTFAPAPAPKGTHANGAAPKPERRVERIANADAYQQEGPLTTFFAIDGGRQVIDSWSRRVASFRTAEIVAIRRVVETANEIDERPPTGALALVQTA